MRLIGIVLPVITQKENPRAPKGDFVKGSLIDEVLFRISKKFTQLLDLSCWLVSSLRNVLCDDIAWATDIVQRITKALIIQVKNFLCEMLQFQPIISCLQPF